MPSVPIYIRQEDWEKWQSIKDKPTFLHNALNVREAYNDLNPVDKQSVREDLQKKIDAISSPAELPEPEYDDVDYIPFD